MPQVTLGGCQCGATRYEAEGTLPRPYACHCRDCQKQSASAFAMQIMLARTSLRINGPIATFDKTADSGNTTTCYFCSACGTRLFHISNRSSDWVTLKVGTLDDTSNIRPVSHIWVSRKQPWVQLDPSATIFEQQPEDLRAWRLSLVEAATASAG